MRSPQAATQSITYTAPGLPMIERWNAASSVEYAYLANVFVFACVRAIVNAILAGRFVTGLDPTKPAARTNNSRLAYLLGPPPGSPNPAWTARRMWAAGIAQYLVTGKLGWEVETADGTQRSEITRLWPLVSQYLDPIPSQGGDDYWDAFKYGRKGKQKTLQPWQCVYVWNPSPDDFRQPLSALQAARLDVDVAIMSDRYMRAFLKNDARPAAIVVTEAFEQDSERQSFRRQFTERYGGPDQAGRTAFVEATGIKDGVPVGATLSYQQLGLSQKDAQFLAIYERKIQNVCIGLGVPMGMLDASGRTFSNAGLETRNFYEDTVMPLAVELADSINTTLAPRLGNEVGWFDFSHIEALRPPQKFQNVNYEALLRVGAIDAVDIRDDLGLDDNGTAIFDQQGFLWQAQGAAALITAGLPPSIALGLAQLPNDGVSDVPPTVVDVTPPPPRLTAPRASQREYERRAQEAAQERRARTRAMSQMHVETLIPSWKRAFLTLFDRQAQTVAARMTGKRGYQALRREHRADAPPGNVSAADAVFDQLHWREQTANLASSLLDGVYAVAATRVATDLGISFDVQAPYAVDFVQERANQLAGDVTDTTYQAVQDAMSAGIDAGEGAAAIARRLRTIVGLTPTQAGQVDDAILKGASDDELAGMRSQMLGDRAEVIARTEVPSGLNGSTWQMGQNLPDNIVAEAEWLAIHDSRTREAHALADGQVRPKGQPFDVGGEKLRYPGDPSGSAGNVVQCRCVMALISNTRSASRSHIEVRTAASLLTRLAAHELERDDVLVALGVAAA